MLASLFVPNRVAGVVPGKRGEQRGQLDQPATADNGIDEAGKERREPERKEDEIDIHGFVSRETGGHHGVP